MKSVVFANKVYDNISAFRVTQKQIDEDTFIDELIRQSRHWFSILNDAQDSGTLRNLVWQLRTTLQLTILPFDDPELNIKGLMNAISDESQYYPELKEPFERLDYTVSHLLKNPINPKGKVILDELLLNGHTCTGIVTSMARWKSPGWPNNVQKYIRNKGYRVNFIQSKTQLKSLVYKRLILPGNGRFSPLLKYLMTGGHCEELLTVYYRQEGYYVPRLITLPETTVNIKPSGQSFKIVKESVENDDTEVNRWLEESFWNDIRERSLGDNSFAKGEDHSPFLVNTRLVLLENGSTVFLGEDQKIPEISELVEGKENIACVGKALPYKITGELGPGDLIVLRTEGGGDYVAEIADAMIVKEGHQECLNGLNEWKTLLQAALIQFGEKHIFKGLNEKGCNLKHSNYIWMWTTDQVIAPQDKSTFLCLLQTLFDFDSALPATPDKLCDLYWEQIQKIRQYRRNAGLYLRRELLEKLKGLIKGGIKIDNVYTLQLGGDTKGSLSVFRVAAVDEITSQISYYKAGVVIKG